MHGGIVSGIGDLWRRYYRHSLHKMKLDRPISEPKEVISEYLSKSRYRVRAIQWVKGWIE